MMRKRLIAMASGLALVMSLSLGAVAATSNGTFVSGYDDEQYVLVYTHYDTGEDDVAEGEDPDPCADIEDDGTYSYTLGDESVVTSEDDDEDVDDEEPREVTTWEVTLTDEDGDEVAECTLTGVDTTGPEGQVNHGTVVSAFVRSLDLIDFDGPKGCLVSAVARSDWGKGDQQVNVDEGDEAAESAEAGDTGEVTLSVDDLDCGQPEWLSDRTEDDDAKGPPEWAGKPDHAGPPEWAGGPDGEPEDEEADEAEAADDDEDRGGPPPWAGKPGGPNNDG